MWSVQANLVEILCLLLPGSNFLSMELIHVRSGPVSGLQNTDSRNTHATEIASHPPRLLHSPLLMISWRQSAALSRRGRTLRYFSNTLYSEHDVGTLSTIGVKKLKCFVATKNTENYMVLPKMKYWKIVYCNTQLVRGGKNSMFVG